MGQVNEPPQPTQAPSPRENGGPVPGPRRNRLPVYVLVFLLVVAVVVGFLWYDLRAAYHDTLTYWDSSLSNSADEQASVETLWLLERRTDTEAIANRPDTIRLLEGRARGGNLTATRQEVERGIEEMARINGFMGGAVADTECRIVAQTGAPAETREGIQKACREAQATGHFSIAASYPQPAHVLLNLAFPVSTVQRALPAAQPSRHVSGAVVMISEPKKTVFRFFAEKSRPDRFAETEVMWQDEGEAVSFSPRLNMMGLESLFREPLGGNAFESRAARVEHVEFGEFIDYRGVRVFGVARPILPAGASLARKVDRDQALSDFHRRALLEWLAGSLSLLLVGFVIAAQHRHLAMRDLQEKLRQQQALRETERRYRVLFESAGDAIFLIRGDTFIDCNQRALEMYHCTRDEILGQTIIARYPQSNPGGPDPRQEALEKLRQARDGHALRFEWRALRLDGTTFDAEITLSRLGLEGDGLLLALVRDVSDRKRAETELVDRLRFETVLADLSARFVNVAAEELGGEIEAAQHRVCESLGLDGCSLWQASEESPSSFKLTYTHRPLGGPPITVQMDAQEYFPWSYQQIMSGKSNVITVSSLAELPKEAARDLETYRQFGVKSVLTIGLAAGGRPPVGALAFSSIREERTWPEEIVKRLQLVAQMFSNALSRQRSERALRESEERFRGLSNASLEGTMIHEQGVILDLNLAFARLFGYERPEELCGRRGLEILLDPESRERIRQRMQRQDTGPIEVRCVRKDGTTFLGESDSRPVKYLGHDATIVSCRDISQLKQAQEERQRSFHQLRALAARLQSVREEERKRLARDIHDQLGQALTAIKLDLSSLVRELPAAQSTLLNKGSPLLQLVDETIESVRRISTDLRPGMLDDLGLAATVEWAGEEFAARTGTKCFIDLPSEQIAIDSETATALFRIFQETLTNVARHAKASEVKVRLAEEDSGLTLEVHDNGRGIEEDELASADSLGILGMRERALLLGGTLTITGGPGKGTSVRIRIPRVRRA